MLNNILCIDDDSITIMLFKMVVSKSNFSQHITVAKNGEQALDIFKNLKANPNELPVAPELIFLDLNMPVMNGWQFLDEFESTQYSEFSNTKIIILSSTIDPVDLEKSKKHPMVIDFLSKPINKEMLAHIQKIL